MFVHCFYLYSVPTVHVDSCSSACQPNRHGDACHRPLFTGNESAVKAGRLKSPSGISSGRR